MNLQTFLTFFVLAFCGLCYGYVSPRASFSTRKHLTTAISKSARSFKSFDEMMEKLETPVLVDFFAPWCGPCVMMSPILETLAGRMENEIKVAKVDTDKNPRLGSRFQVEALPTLILFNKGQVIERFVGYRSADELENEVKRALLRIPKQ